MNNFPKVKFTKGPHFAVQYANYINMQGQRFYDDKDNLLDAEKVGEETALANGLLYSQAYRMFHDHWVELDLLEGILMGQSILTPLAKHSIEAMIKDKKSLIRKLTKNAQARP